MQMSQMQMAQRQSAMHMSQRQSAMHMGAGQSALQMGQRTSNMQLMINQGMALAWLHLPCYQGTLTPK